MAEGSAPPSGAACGLAGGKWSRVEPLIIDVPVSARTPAAHVRALLARIPRLLNRE